MSKTEQEFGRIRRSANIMDGRPGFQLRTNWGQVGALLGGGHICELSLKSNPGVKPLWRPQWKTIDPHHYAFRKHEGSYGPPPDGPLLAGIAGHSISFDHFGPPSKEEIAAGLATHGEAPSSKWKLLDLSESPCPRVTYGLTLRGAQIDFHRTISADSTNPVIYCEEQATNLGVYDRPISWNEHVTFGPPFLQEGVTVFDMPAGASKVCSLNSIKRPFLKPDTEFTWPLAPTKRRGKVDLRFASNRKIETYTAQLLDPNLDTAFISACNPVQRFLVVYVFRRADFPWVGNWEERGSRVQPPWNARTFCRGIEFSTTPFAIPRRETIDQGTLFDESTYRWLPAKSKLTVRYLILLFKTPEAFLGVREVSIKAGRVRLIEANPSNRELSMSVARFL